MKNLIRIPLIMAISVLCCRSGRAQEFYRGEMFVTGQQFSLADGRLNIDLSVDFEGLRMPSDESLIVTPVLISGENEQALPAVLINGTEKQKVYQRQQEFTGNGRPSPIPAVVIRNDARMARSFRYRVAVPYQEWMKDALLLIRSQECACHGRQGSIYEDKIADRLNLPKVRTSVWDTDTDRKYLTWVNFIEPAPDKDTLHAVTGSIPYFGKEQRDKRERPLGELSITKQNFEIYHRMRNALQDIRREAGTKLVKVKITGYGAPVGNLQKNEVDALVRSLKLKDYRYQIEQLQYMQEDVMEERRLKVLEAYNAVTEQLATIKAKAETAALYNAQMKISENNFIQGAIDIIALSLERARRTGAVTNYEQSRVALHNSIVLLEMLTNVKVITDK